MKTTFLAHAVVALIFGLGNYLIPNNLTNWFNWVPFDPMMTRLMGAASLGLAVSSWLSYQASRWEQVRIVVLMEIAYTFLALLITLYGVLFASAPAFSWVLVVIFAVFAAAFTYFYRQASP